MSFALITDSCCNLTDDIIERYSIEMLSFFVRDGDKEYLSYVKGQKTDNKRFYEMMRNGKMLTTSYPTMQAYKEKFESIVQKGKDILHISFSSALSGAYSAAQTAAQEIVARYKERKILVLNSRAASMGEGLIVYEAAKRKEKGETLEQVGEWVQKNKQKVCHWFTVNDLFHLKKGGRVSAATAIVGSTLGIKPILHVNDEGELINVGKVRGREKSIVNLADRFAEHCVNPKEQTIFISHGDCEKEALFLKDEVKKRAKVKDVIINCIDPVIGAHSGPGTLALFFFGDHR